MQMQAAAEAHAQNRCLSLCVSPCVSHCVSHCVCVSPSLSLAVRRTICLSLCVSLCAFHCASQHASLYLFDCLSLSLCVYLACRQSQAIRVAQLERSLKQAEQHVSCNQLRDSFNGSPGSSPDNTSRIEELEVQLQMAEDGLQQVPR